MKMSSLEKYADYIQKVLGVRELILSEPAAQSVLFVVQDGDAWGKASNDLFLKMSVAMKLTPSEYRIIKQDQLQNVDISSFAAIVHFVPGESSPGDDVNVFYVTSPSELLVKPQLKVEAWGALQKVMGVIGKV